LEVDLEAQPVTDIHCFSFAPKPLTRRSLSDIFLSGGPTVKGFRGKVREDDLRSSVAYRRMIHELSALLNTGGYEAAVLRSRNEKAKEFSRYVKVLFDDARITSIAIDNGIEPIEFDRFRSLIPCRPHRVFRIEPLLKKLLETSKSFGDLSDSFDDAINSAVKKQGFVGFKSIAAYRTGLDVGDPSESEARRSFGDHRKGRGETEWFGPRVKAVRDYFLCRTAEKAHTLGVFLQIHTGVGDTDVVADKCSPLLLKDFLKLDEVSKAPVVLIHGGFPYTLEAAWLANVFPNVYFELSTPLPPIFLPALSKKRFRDVLEMVPLTRILYGSDAIEIPENHWLSAKLTKRALGSALGDLVTEGVLDDGDARRAGKLILNENVSKLIAGG
jgi:uncharacterized protein